MTDAQALREAAERDEARQIVRDIYWMALRYADGRRSYAVSMCNDALRKGYDAGWLPPPGEHTPQFARDGDFDAEWKRLEAALDAKERELAAERKRADENWKLAEHERHDANRWHIEYEAALARAEAEAVNAARAREALEPFSTAADGFNHGVKRGVPDSFHVIKTLTVGHLRHARDVYCALTPSTKTNTGERAEPNPADGEAQG